MPDFTSLDWSGIWPFLAVGFIAQLIDGALGMAFGLINSTLLVSVIGLPPALASASVHMVESFTTAASGLSHVYNRNVDWKLLRRLLLPGLAGGILGAYVLSNVDAAIARPFVIYLAGVGLFLLFRAWRGGIKLQSPKVVDPLGAVGGFIDAAGGGGWGPVVTSNLLVQGASPRTTIGTVNTAEFFLTTTVSVVSFTQMGAAAFTIATIGLLAGGLIAAPLGGLLARCMPARPLLAMVGTLLTATSAFSVWQALG